MIWVFQGYHFYAVRVFDVAANRNNNYFGEFPKGDMIQVFRNYRFYTIQLYDLAAKRET